MIEFGIAVWPNIFGSNRNFFNEYDIYYYNITLIKKNFFNYEC